MSKLSVPQAAERLGVSSARVRQRIDDGSLVAEKIGGRWLVDLEASQAAPGQAGRPVAPSSVWWSIVAAEIAKAVVPGGSAVKLQKALGQAADAAAIHKAVMPSIDVSGIRKALKPVFDSAAFKKALMTAIDVSELQEAMKPALDAAAIQQSLLPRMRLAEFVLASMEQVPTPGHRRADSEPDWVGADFVAEAKRLSRSSRNRAVHRVAEAAANRDHDALLAWLSNRASRRLYVAAPADLESLRADERLVISGLSHSASGMEDPRVVEGYVDADELASIVADHWLERPNVDERPNVVLHAGPVRPPAVGPMLLAADLAEHRGPREVARAHELLDEWIDALIPETDSEVLA